MNLENEFVPYEQALVLKELGFDEKCGACYYKKFDNQIGYHKVYRDFNFVQLTVSAPTFSQAFKWFREKHNLYQDISTFVWDYDKKQLAFSLRIYLNPLNVTTEKKVHPEVYETYEEAELECLKKLIQIVKEK